MQCRRRHTITGLAVALVGLMLLPAISVFAAKNSPNKISKKAARSNLETQKHNLEAIQTEIKNKEQKISTLKKRESSIVVTLDDLDRRIDSATDKKRQLELRRQQMESDMRNKGNNITELEQRIGKLNGTMTSRLRNLEQLGDGGFMRLLLSLDDFRDLGEAHRVVRRVVMADLRLIENYKTQQLTLSTERTALRGNQQKLQEVLASLDTQNREIQTQRQRQQQLLKMTRSQRDFNRRSLDELKDAAASLQLFIDKMLKDGYHSEFASMRGMLPLPIVAPVIGKYGKFLDPKFKTPIQRNGIEIAARKGQQLRAVYSGKVIYSGWFTGYGKIIIIDHGDNYYSMSAHLDKHLKDVGETVESGETIGLAGDTGSLNGTLLYFELRHRGQAIDPLPWFNRVQPKPATGGK